MTPFVYKLIPRADIELFQQIREVVNAMDDIDLGYREGSDSIVLSCHMLARAIGQCFNLKVQDGYFAVGSQHSWLLTPNGHIIDTYPVGIIGGPLLVENIYPRSPGQQLYKVDPLEIAKDLRGKMHWINCSVPLLVKEIRRVLKKK